MNRYEKYKDSGIAWIGDIPEHWERLCLKRHSIKIGDGLHGTPEFDDKGECFFVNGNNLGLVNIQYKNTTQKVNFTEYKKYKKSLNSNTVLVSLNGTIGSISMYNNEAIILSKSVGYINLRPCFRLYFYYLLQSNIISRQWQLSLSGTTIANLSLESLKNTYIVLPSLLEQQQIANYLDWKCGEVDKIVAVREEQIKLLGELRTSVISRAVTKGLNPDAPLRDSGIPWIGSIPAHWEYGRLKYVTLKSFAGVWGEEAKDNENDVRCYRVADFDYPHLTISDRNPTNRNVDKDTYHSRKVECNDILIEKSGGGDIAPVGRAVLVSSNQKAICSNFIHCIKVDSKTSNKFLLYTLNAMYSNKINLLHFNQTTGIQNLKVSEYLGNSVFMPKLEEQQAIADYLDKKTAEIDSAVAKYKEQIAKLKEYRQALITEVVTGKIDVRDVVIPKKS
ncbi:MAG: restriction endonuclease subunit S [Rikenellaceae bacterium]